MIAQMVVKPSKARSEAPGTREVLFELQGSMSDSELRNLCFLLPRNGNLPAATASIMIFCVRGVQATRQLSMGLSTHKFLIPWTVKRAIAPLGLSARQQSRAGRGNGQGRLAGKVTATETDRRR